VALASRLHWRLLVGTILVLMAAAWIAPRYMHAPGIQENRVLAAAPAWPKGWRDLDSFRKATDAYVADRFPIRPYLIATLNRLRMMVGVSGSPRVIVGREGWLFYDDDTHLGAARGDPPMTGPEVRDWLMTFAGRTEYMQARHTPFLVVVGPAKETIYPQYGPRWYSGPSPERTTVMLPKLAHEAGLAEVLSLYPAVAEASRGGPVSYSLHDTHWNGYGAYAGYAAIIGRLHEMGLTDAPHPMSDFQIIPGGSGDQPRDLALMLGVANSVKIDFVHIENPVGEARIKRTFLTERTEWTAPQIVDTGEVGKPVLLLTRDSFSNEILPLLYPHFSRIILAHNDDGFWRPDLVERFKPDIVVAEIVEHGLRVSMGKGPAPSAEATARIDRLLGSQVRPKPASSTPAIPKMAAPDARTAAILAAATPTANCNIEIVKLSPGIGGEANFMASGWMSEVGRQVTSPKGLLALKGPGGVFVGEAKMNKARPDVAAYFKNPSAEESGFVGSFYIGKLAPGLYTPFAYRRAGGGWIGCEGRLTVTAP
jgi:SGNH hydrolase-like domain, acetyltransferase AlgX